MPTLLYYEKASVYLLYGAPIRSIIFSGVRGGTGFSVPDQERREIDADQQPRHYRLWRRLQESDKGRGEDLYYECKGCRDNNSYLDHYLAGP